MDDEMIERCAIALGKNDKTYDMDYNAAVITIIKAMREPTEKIIDAMIEVGPDRGPSEYWYAGIDAIIK